MSEENKQEEQALPLPSAADDPVELASSMLYLYTPKFSAAVDHLSSNALRRVLKKLVSFPLNEKDYKATSQLEQDAFAMGDRLMEAKFLILMDNYHKLVQEHLPKIEEKTEEKENG